MRIGVIGTGWWATVNHIPTVQASGLGEVVAICDLDPGRLATVGDRFGVAGRYTEVASLLAAEQLDGVMIATPHTAHAAAAVAALQAGCHVLIEKPLATTPQDARAIVAAARQANRQVLVPCGWNFRDYTAQAAAWVEAGQIGEIRHVVCEMASALGDLFAGQPMQETADALYRPPASTWADPSRAGGYGWGQMSHSLAWVYRVTGLAPATAFCLAGASAAGVDYYDAAVLRMSNGATMALSGAATVPKQCGFQMDIRLFGTQGMIVFDIERERLELHRNDGTDISFPIAVGQGGYDGTLPVTRFLEICAGQAVRNDADAENGALVVATLAAMYRSARTNRLEPVEV